jgi:cytochrome bd ubiquinol oxidase subunit I
MSRLRTGGCVLVLIATLVTAAWADGPISVNQTSKDVYYGTEGVVSGPPAPHLHSDDYPKLNLPSVFGESRLWIWVIAQQHFYFGGFVLGALFLAMAFELIGLLVRDRERAKRFDRLAYRTVALALLVCSVAAIFGGVLFFTLLALYPTLMGYLGNVLRASFLAYGPVLLLLFGSIYFYYVTWHTLQHRLQKWLHATMGLIVNGLGLVVLMLANSWSTFMLSPAGVDEAGRFLGDHGHVLHNALWNPMNVHRFFGNLLFASAVLGAYAAYGALTAKTRDDRAYYDWMGAVTLVVLVLVLFTITFGGYWLMLEIFRYRQQMGITLSGGLLAWWNILVVSLMGLLFLGINYYVWHRIGSRAHSIRYRFHVKFVFFLLAVAMMVYIAPHTLVITPLELKVMGGRQHPVVGNYGVMSSKNTAAYMMMLVTGWSLLMMWRSRNGLGWRPDTWNDTALLGLYLAGAGNVILLGIYGFYVPANIRVGFIIPGFFTMASALGIGALLNARSLRGASSDQPFWGGLSVRGHVALFFLAVTISWLMGMGGYLRSAVRLFWHVMEISRDTSPWAFTHTIGFAANMITFNVLVFWGMFLLVLWLAKFHERSVL